VDDAAVTGVDGFSMLDPGWRGLVKITAKSLTGRKPQQQDPRQGH
jgi:hypothetical protein